MKKIVPFLLFAIISYTSLSFGEKNKKEMYKEMKDSEWREKLSPEEYHILRENGTERPFGKIYEEFKNQGEGDYFCVACNSKLFSSDGKFESACGWPSFFEPSHPEALIYLEDKSMGTTRTEIRCATCNSHLGHLFVGEGFNTPTDKRYCLNGTALRFVKKIKDSDSSSH